MGIDMDHPRRAEIMTKTGNRQAGPKGQLITAEADSAGPSLSYQLYLPADLDPTRPLLTAVHGISRNPHEWMDWFRSCADAYRVPLLAPLFSKPQYADFQRLGRYGRGERADHALIRLVDRLSREHGFSPRMALFGFSGGAQFAHRFAMAHPGRVESLVLGAAGWYTWPDPTSAFPYGTRPINSLPGVRFDPLNLLSLPVRVIVGERDTARDASLNRRRQIDKTQGRNRVERARNWVNAMREYAEANTMHCQIDFQALPGADHAILDDRYRDTFGKLVCEWLYQNLDNKKFQGSPT